MDLIVHAKPIRKGFFTSYKDDAPKEFLIEIKKKEDLKDVGGIIRQINEYKEYYNFNPYYSDIVKEDNNRDQTWILLIDSFDENYREMFEDEKIEIIDLSIEEAIIDYVESEKDAKEINDGEKNDRTKTKNNK